MSVTLLGPIASGGVSLPLYSSQVSAGFPSPAADHLEKLISLDDLFEIRAPHMYPWVRWRARWRRCGSLSETTDKTGTAFRIGDGPFDGEGLLTQ